MARVLFFVALITFLGYTSAIPSYPVYIIPEHRAVTELKPLKAAEDVSYEYQIVPADEYAVAEVDYDSDSADASIVSSIISSIWEVIPIPSPFTAIKKIASIALSVGKWVVKKGIFVAIGAGLVIGFCALTPFCTLVIEKPFAKHIESLNIPYLDDAEHYFREAYDKYHELF